MEPLDTNVHLLRQSLRHNGLEALVTIHHVGIASQGFKKGELQTFSPLPGNLAASAIHSVKMAESGVLKVEDTNKSTVSLVTLRDIIATEEVELLALNCQGCEYDALVSLTHHLSDVRGVLLYVYFKSMFRCTKRHAESKQAVRLLQDGGFCIYDLLDMERALRGNDALKPIDDIETWQDKVAWGRTKHDANFFILASRHCKHEYAL